MNMAFVSRSRSIVMVSVDCVVWSLDSAEASEACADSSSVAVLPCSSLVDLSEVVAVASSMPRDVARVCDAASSASSMVTCSFVATRPVFAIDSSCESRPCSLAAAITAACACR